MREQLIQKEGKTYFYNVPESEALVVEDYPWGYKLRTKQRYWIESNKRGEQRFVYQTLNPKTDRWCAPKKSTYNHISLIVRLEENGHFKTTGLSKYASVDEMKAFLSKHGGYLTAEQVKDIETTIKAKTLLNKKFEEMKTHAITKMAEKTTIDLDEKLIWSKSEITKSSEDLKLFAIDLSGYAIKKRCRKQDHYYKRLFFTAPTPKTEEQMQDIKKLAREHCKENLRSYDNMRIVIKETTYQAPTENSPMFYGFKEMLMGNKMVVSL